MDYFNPRLRFIDQFLAHFKPIFSNTQMSSLCTLVYGMFFDYKRLSLSIGQCKEAIATLIIIDSTYLLSKNKNIAEALKIKSQRFIERLEN